MSISLNEVTAFVEANIGGFHERRILSLEKLELNQILKRKNPYLFRAKNILTAPDLVRGLLDAHLSSQEEAIFGEFLEQLAIFVCGKVYSGKKSVATGIDLEFSKDDAVYLVSIKSGPNWGNSSQIAKMIESFKRAQRILRTNNPKSKMVAVNGCCYGKDSNPDKGDYLKLCGQEFWTFISGNNMLFIEIIEPLGYRAKERNDEFNSAYIRIINRFTLKFLEDFCFNGDIDWERLVRFNSESNVVIKE
jgi:hypothetical protein